MRLISALSILSLTLISSACTPKPMTESPTPTPIPTDKNVDKGQDKPQPDNQNQPGDKNKTETPNNAGKIINISSPINYNYGDQYRYVVETKAQVAIVDANTNSTTEKQDPVFRSVPTLSQQIIITTSDSGFIVLDPIEPESRNCNDVRSLIVRAKNILPSLHKLSEKQQLENKIKIGTTWTDSVTTDGCRGNIPMNSTSIQKYTIVNDSIDEYKNHLLIIEKTETFISSGEGNQNQHRIFVNATGSSIATLYFDLTLKTFKKISSVQTSNVQIKTSGKTDMFLQKVNEDINLVR